MAIPKVAKYARNPPSTTSQARRPPSGASVCAVSSPLIGSSLQLLLDLDEAGRTMAA